ncbi:MAG: RagB/SusD family nutrient uptake outer membrane protein [Bacteroidota bacterium]
MKRVILFICSLCVAVACNNRLEIEPEQEISSEVALSTEQGVKTTLVGCYDLLSQGLLWGGHLMLDSELYADAENQIWTGFSFDINQIFQKNIFVGNAFVEAIWRDAYETINLCNNVIAAVEVVNEAERPAAEAAARFIRGALYFELVNLYGKTWIDGDPNTNLAVPLIVQPSQDIFTNAKPTRSTVAEVYALILEDLLFAKENLPPQNGIFANTFAASALLTRVYLMQERFDLAGTEADRIISSNVFSLVPNFSEVFNQSNNTSEDIFAMQITSQDGVNNMNFYYAGENEGGGGFIGISEEHIAKYEAEDQRANLFYFDAITNTRRTAKWLDNPDRNGNINIIRLSEMYLTRAECNFRLGKMETVAEDINIVRARTGLLPLSLEELTLERILEERYLELAFEGHLYRDTKRNRMDIGAIPFDAPRMIFPIPQREMDLNALLIQNEGY